MESYSPIGADYLNPTDDPQFQLGAISRGENGSEWIYVQDSGSGITANFTAFVTATFTATMISTSNDARGNILGVAAATFAASQYGWLQRKGTADVQVSASAAANAGLNTTATAGQLDDDGTSTTFSILGLVLTTARAASAGVAPAMLNYPSVGPVI